MSSIGSPGGFFGNMGSPSSFTSPPMDPKILAMLAQLGQGGGQQPPGMMLPQPAGQPGTQMQTAPGMQPGMPQPGQPPGGGSPQLMQALQLLSKLPPDQQKAIMARIQGGAAKPMGMQPAMSQ